MGRRANALRKIRFDEVSLVDAPASPGADILFAKSLSAFVPLLYAENGVTLLKMNPNHDERGRFTSAGDAGSGSTGRSLMLGTSRRLFSDAQRRSLASHTGAALAGAAAGAIASHPSNRQALMRAVRAGLEHPATQDMLRRAAAAAKSPQGRKAAEAAFSAATAAAGAGKPARALGLGTAAGLISGLARFGKAQEYTSMPSYRAHYVELIRKAAAANGRDIGTDEGDPFDGTHEDDRDPATRAAELELILATAAQHPCAAGEGFEAWLRRIFSPEGANALHSDERAALAAMRGRQIDMADRGRQAAKAEAALVAKAKEIRKQETTTFEKAFVRAATRNPELYAVAKAAAPINDDAEAALTTLNKRASEIAKASGGTVSFQKAFGQACAADPSSYAAYRNRGATSVAAVAKSGGPTDDEAAAAARRIKAKIEANIAAGMKPTRAAIDAYSSLPADYHICRQAGNCP